MGTVMDEHADFSYHLDNFLGALTASSFDLGDASNPVEASAT